MKGKNYMISLLESEKSEQTKQYKTQTHRHRHRLVVTGLGRGLEEAEWLKGVWCMEMGGD